MEIKLLLPENDDVEFWLKVRSQASTQKNNPIGILSLNQLSQQINDSNQSILKRQKIHRFIIHYENQKAGVISLKDINWDSGVAEVGYLIDEAFHNKGIASEAVKLIVKMAFGKGGLNKLKATTILQNLPSNRVLEKNGFKVEGILRQEFLVQNNLHDVYMWSILKSESNH